MEIQTFTSRRRDCDSVLSLIQVLPSCSLSRHQHGRSPPPPAPAPGSAPAPPASSHISFGPGPSAPTPPPSAPVLGSRTSADPGSGIRPPLRHQRQLLPPGTSADPGSSSSFSSVSQGQPQNPNNLDSGRAVRVGGTLFEGTVLVPRLDRGKETQKRRFPTTHHGNAEVPDPLGPSP